MHSSPNFSFCNSKNLRTFELDRNLTTLSLVIKDYSKRSSQNLSRVIAPVSLSVCKSVFLYLGAFFLSYFFYIKLLYHESSKMTELVEQKLGEGLLFSQVFDLYIEKSAVELLDFCICGEYLHRPSIVSKRVSIKPYPEKLTPIYNLNPAYILNPNLYPVKAAP